MTLIHTSWYENNNNRENIEIEWGKTSELTERKSLLFDGYKQAGRHSIVIFGYSTYNSKPGHRGGPLGLKKQETSQRIHASGNTFSLVLYLFLFF